MMRAVALRRGTVALRRDWLAPIALFLLVLIGIALIGGGWLALGRVDPLLAVPGAGWAAVAAVWASRDLDNAGPIMAASALVGLSLLAAIQLADGMGGFRLIEWSLSVVGLLGAAFGIWLLAAGGCWLAGRHRWRRKIVHLAVLPLFAIMWATIAAPLIARAYAIDVPIEQRPKLVWMTSLPIVDSQAFDLQSEMPSTEAQVQPIPNFLAATTRATRLVGLDTAALTEADVLLLAHPPALDPAQLVAVDGWVRAGGRVVVLADGLSSWPAAWPLGDPRNPPVTSLLGPLLAHWGVELDAPAQLAESRITMRDSGERLELFSAGRFRRVHSGCLLRAAGLIGDCRVGRGRVVLIADADLLNPALWAGAQGGASSVDALSGNMLWLLDKLSDDGGRPVSFSLARPSWSRSRQALLAAADR